MHAGSQQKTAGKIPALHNYKGILRVRNMNDGKSLEF